MRSILNPRRRPSERGFTLLELMYAFGYFMLGIAGLTCFHAVAANATQHAADISMATMLTTGTIESIRVDPNIAMNLPITKTSSYDRYGTVSSNGNYKGQYFTVVSISSQPTGVNYFDVTVQTNWYQLPVATFQHGVIMQTRIPTN
jgi:Tfp pilus assembly protein PilV